MLSYCSIEPRKRALPTPSPERMYHLIGVLIVSLLSQSGHAETLRVVASITPVHSLVAAVMEGVATPQLLNASSASPHEHSLRPSDARRIVEADLVFWIGPELEGFLVGPLANVDPSRSVPLLQTPGVHLLPIRQAGTYGGTLHEPSAEAKDDGLVADPHLWMDPRNAVALAMHIRDVLRERAPAWRSTFETNTTRLIERLEDLDARTVEALAPFGDVPFVVYHDAYQYYETRYGLNVLGAVVAGEEHRPGVRRLLDIRDRIRSTDARCVFSGPFDPPALIDTVTEGTTARSAVIDPLGTSLSPGPENYFLLMDALTATLVECLELSG